MTTFVESSYQVLYYTVLGTRNNHTWFPGSLVVVFVVVVLPKKKQRSISLFLSVFLCFFVSLFLSIQKFICYIYVSSNNVLRFTGFLSSTYFIPSNIQSLFVFVVFFCCK